MVESEGYCRWSRVEETVQFAKRMGFRKLGIASCISFVDHARVLSGILESHGFEVVSVACKNGEVPKEEMGLADSQKVSPGRFEPMCNPISQAELLNRHGCELTVLMGLCVGHDSLFFRYSTGLVTVLVVKDRVLAHNPIGALNLADGYYGRVWGPHRPGGAAEASGGGEAGRRGRSRQRDLTAAAGPPRSGSQACQELPIMQRPCGRSSLTCRQHLC